MAEKTHLAIIIALPLILNLLVTLALMYSLVSLEEFLRTPFYYTYTYGLMLWPAYHIFLAYLVYHFLRMEGENLGGIIGPIRDRPWFSLVVNLGLLGLFILIFQITEPMISSVVYGPEWWSQFVTEFQKIPLPHILHGVLITSLTAGICEEIVWRGYIQTRLERKFNGRAWMAVVIQAIHFGLWHFISIHAIFTAIFGFASGLIYAKTRRLFPIMIAHWMGDVIGFSTLYFSKV
ncbi:MAG: CPBP family intramembrane metalloprotease [Aigarchaeota archaeon]|nr:CPBP family intramembrane metalloprotease [Aigarchaeota archaeon]MDW8021115.1 CPBP family intramembrane glutamic endopeptidase [Nitrososphaerota archaeon]